MSSAIPRRARARTFLLWAAPLSVLGCGGGGTDVVLPSLSVSVTTQGVEIDPDGYDLIIDALQNHPVGVAATLVIERLADGDHIVELGGMAPNCSAGENPRTVSVRSGATATADFSVTCSPTTGSIEVATVTTGGGSDPDGFLLTLDGGERGPIGSGATLNLPGLSPGPHSVGLSGLAGNCEVEGENPRSITVVAGQTVQAAFSVTCLPPGTDTGTLEITTSTTGSDPDLDGYTVSLDGGAGQTMGSSASLSLPNIASGPHQVELLGVATNCSVSGQNPRSVTVPPRQATSVQFLITCSPIGPETGTIEVTTTTGGTDPDPDGYRVSVDGGASQPIGSNARLTLPNVSSAAHRLELLDIAANCTLSGANPRTVTVTAGATTTVAFAITCTTRPPETGDIRVSVATSGTSPDADGYTISVDGGAPQSVTVNGSRTVQDLGVGSHSVLLGGVAANCTVAGENPRSVNVTAGQVTPVSFAVSCVSTGPSVNLRIEGMYLTQSTQRLAGDVPLVQGRDGFLRVFVTASGSNTARPAVRVRLYQNESVVRTFTITTGRSSTPTSVQEESLGNSWNLDIPGSLLAAGTTILADADPENEVAETNESDNSYPVSGTPRPLSIQPARRAAIRFVPILQTSNNLQGNVGNPGQLVQLVRRMYPLGELITEVRGVFSVPGPLQASDGNGQWGQILSDLEALRVMEASDRTYYGLVRLDYISGIVGNGFVGLPSAIGTDHPAEAPRILAHELGHTWGELHTPCGGPPGIDPHFPYRSGNIGVYGYDGEGGTLKSPSLPDIMGYCSNPWISDYVYERVMRYRQLSGLRAPGSGLAQPSMLVWGRIVNGVAVLEPTFQVVTRPHLPDAPGPYSLEAQASDGTRLFAFSFEAKATGNDPDGTKYFAFTVPLDPSRASQVRSVRLSGPGAQVAAVGPSAVAAPRGVSPGDVSLRRDGAGVSLTWNAFAHPMVMVRDPDTREVLAFARGGHARVWSQKSELELVLSDGVRSQAMRRAISR